MCYFLYKTWRIIITEHCVLFCLTPGFCPFSYRGTMNPNLTVLRNILLTFVAFHPTIGYAQGMNDILAQFLVVFDSEVCYCPSSVFNILVFLVFFKRLCSSQLIKWCSFHPQNIDPSQMMISQCTHTRFITFNI